MTPNWTRDEALKKADVVYDILDDGRVRLTFPKTGVVEYVLWKFILTIAEDIKEIESERLI